jgi:hypothetical protein
MVYALTNGIRKKSNKYRMIGFDIIEVFDITFNNWKLFIYPFEGFNLF